MKTVALVLLCSLLIACGFQLKGQSQLPVERAEMTLSVKGFSAAEIKTLRTRLKRAGAVITDQGPRQLKVELSPVVQQQLAGNSAESLRVFSISRRLRFELLTEDGPQQPVREAEQRRELALDTDALLQLREAREEAIQAINSALIEQMIWQLRQP